MAGTKHAAEEPSSAEGRKRARTATEDEQQDVLPIVHHTRRMGAFVAILMNIFLPGTYSFAAGRKRCICEDLAEVLAQVDPSIDKKENFDTYQFANNEVPTWVKNFKKMLTSEERQEGWMTAKKAVKLFFEEITIVTDLLLTTWMHDRFQRQFCLDRLCNMCRGMMESFGTDRIEIFRERGHTWYVSKFLQVRRVLELEGYVRPKKYTAW